MYYLPIKIRNRKFHVCKLEPNSEEVAPIFSFVNEPLETCLFTIDINQCALISSEGYSQNISLRNCNILPIEKLETNYKYDIDENHGIEELYPVYQLKIESPELARAHKKAAAEEKFRRLKEEAEQQQEAIVGALENLSGVKLDSRDLSNSSICKIIIDKAHFPKSDNRFVMEIIFQKDENTSYIYRFRFAYLNKGQIKKDVTLDFGSEASQMSCNIKSTGIQIVRRLNEIVGLEEKSESYRQGMLSDYKYRSIYFINRQVPDSSITCWGDIPMKYGKDSFIQTLIKMNETPSSYSKWTQLPNLKLLELLGADLPWPNPDIALPDGSNVEIESLQNDQNKILRLLLSQFVYVALEELNKNADYLHFILLVPNVYMQDKVYEVLCDLYRDFDIIRLSNEKYEKWKGIEVDVMSESDASFMGYINSGKKYVRGHKHSLIIDVGKGTTDFSILIGDDKNHMRFESAYRAGIPIAGNILTYAFYEALKSWLNQHGITIDDKLQDAAEINKVQLMDFMDNLETLKANYKDSEGSPKAPGIELDDLSKINKYIKEQIIKGNKKLPSIEKYLTERCNQISSEVKEHLKGYVNSNKIQFSNVIFMGNGFKLDLLVDTIKEMLINSHWAIEESFNDIIGGDGKKTLCLKGALRYDDIDVNCQSGLIGSVIIDNETIANSYSKKWYKRVWDWFMGLTAHNIDERFFYGGVHCVKSNITINISCFSHLTGDNSNGDLYLYFVGNGFLLQYKDRSEDDLNWNTTTFGEELINPSLFPFWPNSISNPNMERSTINNTPQNEAQPSQSTGNNTADDEKPATTNNPQNANQPTTQPVENSSTTDKFNDSEMTIKK